ncbi:MAG: hypothetical protein HY716_06250 [Planctomycetes bacterium]|nr:hypothetical protein [Planctomycetota bacterium]
MDFILSLVSLVWQILLGTGCSVLAAFLVWLFWWWRVRQAASRYLGKWKQFDLDGREVISAKCNPIATIRRSPLWWQADILDYEGEHDQNRDPSNPGKRRRLKGRIVVNPITLDRASATLHYTDESDDAEFAIHEYLAPEEGTIYVVPSDPNYTRHVLRRDTPS